MRGSGLSQARREQAAELLLGTAGGATDAQAQLRGALEGLAATCTERLDELAPVPMELAFRDVVSDTTDDPATGYGASAVVAAFYTPDRKSRILIGADGAFMTSALEAVFGSDGSEPAGGEERCATRIAIRLAGAIFEQVADALAPAVFGSNAGLELDKIDAAARLPVTPGRDGPAVTARYGLSTLERAGEMFVTIPQAALQRGQPTGAAPTTAGAAAQDSGWSKRIEQEVQRTQVTLQAVLDERELTLGELAGLHIGQVLSLKATPRSNVKVVCNNQTLFLCELGQTEGVYTLRIKDFPDEQQDLINAITSQ